MQPYPSAGRGQWQGCHFQKHAATVRQDKFGRQYKIKALPAPAFKINKYGQIRVKNDSNSRENGGIQDYVISEPQPAYDAYSTPENWALRGDNSVFWNDSPLTIDA